MKTQLPDSSCDDRVTASTDARVAESDNPLADVVVIIPALNEELALPNVLGDLPDVGRVIVVDNGSTDSTAAVGRQLGATVVSEPNRGYGSACLRGIEEVDKFIAAGGQPPEAIAFVDADYADHVDDLPKIVEPILSGHYDFVLGSRLMGERESGAMPPQAVWGNRLACLLMRIFWGSRYTDLGPMRAMRYDVLKELGMQDRNYGWTVEMQIKAAKIGAATIEIPVPYRRRVGVSKISGTISGTVCAGYKILATIFRYGFFPPTARRRDTK